MVTAEPQIRSINLRLAVIPGIRLSPRRRRRNASASFSSACRSSLPSLPSCASAASSPKLRYSVSVALYEAGLFAAEFARRAVIALAESLFARAAAALRRGQSFSCPPSVAPAPACARTCVSRSFWTSCEIWMPSSISSFGRASRPRSQKRSERSKCGEFLIFGPGRPNFPSHGIKAIAQGGVGAAE